MESVTATAQTPDAPPVTVRATLPQDVVDLIQAHARANRDDIPAALDAAEADVTARDDYAELVRPLVRPLVRQAILEYIYDARHRDNQAINRATRAYGGPPKIHYNGRATRGVDDAYGSLYDKMIAGRTLGSMTKEDLLPAADAEESTGNGHLHNARFLRALDRVVKKGGVPVREAVPLARLKKLWGSSQND